MSYGILSSVTLGFLGLGLDELLTCMHASQLLVILGVLLCVFVFYGEEYE